MSKPSKSNQYVANAVRVWNIKGIVFCLIDSFPDNGGYMVRVFPREGEGHWLPSGPWETEFGAAWGILNWLDVSDLTEK